jgi:outer membrane protein, multidrug efflux system
MRWRGVLAGFTLPLGAAGLIIGCAIKQPPGASDLRQQALPHTQVPDQWHSYAGTEQPVAGAWLDSFDDPLLVALVDEAVTYNADLRVAAARVEQAEGYAKVAGAALYPSVSLLAHGGGKLGGDGSGLQGLWVTASLELDVWGRVRYGKAAARAQYASAAADYAYAQQSLAALVAKTYFMAIEADLQRAIAADALAAAQELVRLAQERERVGSGDDQALADARVNVGSLRDTLRQLEYAHEQALRALELLLGRYPAAELEVATQLASMPAPAPVGLPSELLERRPDVIAAERRVAVAFNRAQEAKAARLPRISLTASGASVSSELIQLQNHSNPVWGIGGTLIAPLYQGGALQAQVAIRTAEQQQAVAEYARAAQRAFGDVEGALSAETALRERVAILDQNVRDSQRALDLAQVQYRVGRIDLRGIEQRQLALDGARTSRLQVQSEQLAQRVNLHLALGGAFEFPNRAASR